MHSLDTTSFKTVEHINSTTYLDMLYYLSDYAASFSLIEEYHNCKVIPIKLPLIKAMLKQYVIDVEQVKFWEGHNYYEEGICGIKHNYKITDESMNVLKQYDSFVDEKGIDIIFYDHHGQCVLHTMNCGKLTYIEDNFWFNFINRVNNNL